MHVNAAVVYLNSGRVEVEEAGTNDSGMFGDIVPRGLLEVVNQFLHGFIVGVSRRGQTGVG